MNKGTGAAEPGAELAACWVQGEHVRGNWPWLLCPFKQGEHDVTGSPSLPLLVHGSEYGAALLEKLEALDFPGRADSHYTHEQVESKAQFSSMKSNSPMDSMGSSSSETHVWIVPFCGYMG